MTWRDDLLPAALDGVEFLYRSVRDRGGRRTVPYEYPGRDSPYIEDLGSKARTWTVDAFLLGPNYRVPLGDLLDVLNTPGVRAFQHPYDGEIPVKLLGEYEVTQSDQEGGTAKISFTLMEAGTAFPLVAVDTGEKVAQLAGASLAVLADRTKFDLLGAIKDVISSVLGALGQALSAINKVNGKIAATFGVLDTAAFLVDSIADNLTELIATPSALMGSLTNLLDSTVGLVKDLLDLIPRVAVDVEEPVFPQAEVLVVSFVELFSFSAVPGTVPTRTPQSDLEVLNFNAVNLHIQAATLALTSAAVAGLTLASSGDAAEIQAVLVLAFDAVLATPDIDVEVFESFAALKAATIQHLTVAQQNLPALADYTPNQTMPALVIAYELYGDATRDREIIARNNIRHPGFVPGGQTLEVLSDD